MAKDDAGYLAFLLDPAAAMVGEARVVVADDPDPVEARRQRQQQLARGGGEPVAAEAVVEAVAEAIERLHPSLGDQAAQRGESRLRIIRWQELSEPREPARLF